MMRVLQRSSSLLAIGFFFICASAYPQELIFKWGVVEDAYDLSTHFKERVSFSLLQENVRYQVEKTCLDLEISHSFFVEAKILPCQFSVFFDQVRGKPRPSGRGQEREQ